jgi:pimeloyl-ACP methyl ester carboxylesterase
MPAKSFTTALFPLVFASTMAAAQGTALDRAPSRFAPYEGTRVHYKSLGTGSSAVVFIHGWNGDMSVWRAQVAAVDGRVRALLVDLPGFGRSSQPQAAYTMDYLAGGVAAVMQAAGVTQAVLVGHSMGTPVARQFYRRHPGQLLGLVAVDGSLRTMFRDTAAVAPLIAQLSGPEYATALGRMFDAMLTTADSGVRASVRRVGLATPKHVALSSLRSMLDPAIWTDDPITVPVLAVMAPNPMWSADYLAYIRRLAPSIRVETLAGAGHFLMLEKPAEFNALLSEFLRGLRLLR